MLSHKQSSKREKDRKCESSCCKKKEDDSHKDHHKKKPEKHEQEDKYEQEDKHCCNEKREYPVRKECDNERKRLELRGECEEIDVVRIGVFANRQPNESFFPNETVAGWDVSLADYIFRQLLGYCIEFYEIPITNVGLNELTCGAVDVIASSTINIIANINTGAGTIPRTALANYLITDIPPDLNFAVIINQVLLPGPDIECGPNTLRDIWLAIGGAGACPVASALRFGTNAPGTVQSNAIRNALTAAYPNCPVATLNAYFTATTVNTSTYTCAQFVDALNSGSVVALIPGPRGDAIQLGVTFAGLVPQENFTLCPNVGFLPGGARGWAIRSCKLALQAQKAFDAAVEDGTYANLIQQAGSFPLFTETCLTAGLGITAGIPPARNASIREGTISEACLKCCSKGDLLCPCAPALIKLYPLSGHISFPIFGDCSNGTLTTITRV